MTPTDGRARESTGARPAYDPAAERTPVARGAAPGVSLGGPSLAVPPVAGEGGYTSPHGQDRERAGLAGMPDPETGAADPATQTAAPVRGRAPRAPVTAGPDGTPASGPPVVTGPSKLAAVMSEDRGPDSLDAHVRRLLRDLNLRGYHTHDSRRSHGGYPDWTIVGTGGVLFRELKTQRGKVSPGQQQWLAALTAARQDADVWRPEDLLSGRIARELAAISGWARCVA